MWVRAMYVAANTIAQAILKKAAELTHDETPAVTPTTLTLRDLAPRRVSLLCCCCCCCCAAAAAAAAVAAAAAAAAADDDDDDDDDDDCHECLPGCVRVTTLSVVHVGSGRRSRSSVCWEDAAVFALDQHWRHSCPVGCL